MRSLGRIAEHDERSRAFPHVNTLAPIKTVMWDHHAPVLDQGDVGSCTGNALAQFMNTEAVHQRRGGNYLTEIDALALYSVATHLDGIPGVYPPNDTGSSGLAVCKAARNAGLISSYRWCFSFQSLLRALQASPVITGTPWHTGMFQPDARGFVVPNGEIAGGHEYLILGADLEHDYLTILNSWGSGWGEAGRARISFTDYQKLQMEHGDVTIPVV